MTVKLQLVGQEEPVSSEADLDAVGLDELVLVMAKNNDIYHTYFTCFAKRIVGVRNFVLKRAIKNPSLSLLQDTRVFVLYN